MAGAWFWQQGGFVGELLLWAVADIMEKRELLGVAGKWWRQASRISVGALM